MNVCIWTGLCSELCDAYKKDFISVKPNLTIVKQACPRVEEISTPVKVDGMETGSPLERELQAGNTSLPELVRSPNIVLSSPARLMPSPTREHNCTPALGNDTSLLLDLAGTTYGDTSDLAAFTGTLRSGKVTPMIFSKDQPGVEDTFCTDIPELRNTVDGVCPLLFLICFRGCYNLLFFWFLWVIGTELNYFFAGFIFSGRRWWHFIRYTDLPFCCCSQMNIDLLCWYLYWATILYIMHKQGHRKLPTASYENTLEIQKLDTYRQGLGSM